MLISIFFSSGMKQFEFPLADEPVKGKWKISASFEGEIANTEFEVKKYGKIQFLFCVRQSSQWVFKISLCWCQPIVVLEISN